MKLGSVEDRPGREGQKMCWMLTAEGMYAVLGGVSDLGSGKLPQGSLLGSPRDSRPERTDS